jgi:hypothetical protein
MALTVVVLVPPGYLGSVASLCLAVSVGALPLDVFNSPLVDVYVAPLEWYIEESDWPGSAATSALIDASIGVGVRLSDR